MEKWISIETPWTHERRVIEFYLCNSMSHEDGKMAKY
jgi:hypothetical protein